MAAAPEAASSGTRIPVAVVDDHHHVLAHWQRWKDAGLLPSGVHMVHFDSHADLGCGSPLDASGDLAAAQASLSRSDSGIAEWILPLAFFGDVASVHWWRPRFITETSAPAEHPDEGSKPQLEGSSPPSDAGKGLCTVVQWGADQDVVVGKDTRPPPVAAPSTAAEGEIRLAVHFPAAYYVSEGAHAPLDCLKSPTTFNLTVGSEARLDMQVPEADEACSAAQSNPWVLDVCLDYFHCRNYFMEDMLSHLSRNQVATLRRVFDAEAAIVGMPIERAQALVREHTWLLGCMLRCSVESAQPSTPLNMPAFFEDAGLELQEFTREAGEGLATVLHEAGLALEAAQLHSAAEAFKEGDTSLPEAASDQPLVASMIESGGPCLIQPHTATTAESMLDSLGRFKEWLASQATLPAAITIACSTGDEFVPQKVVRWLLPQVLSSIGEVCAGGGLESQGSLCIHADPSVEHFLGRPSSDSG